MFDIERSFGRLVHHFIYRIFYGAGEGDELQFSIPALLGICATPAAFASMMLFTKYSTLVLFLLRRPAFDVYKASIPDEYFFIVFSMVVTGSVVVLKWDRLFPDRQDYDNLAALPISSRDIFYSSLVALLFLAGIFAIDINIAAMVIFPYVVTSIYDTFGAYLSFFIAHGAAVILASFLACFGLLSILGFTMLVTPKQYMRRVSLAVRIACALGLVATAASAFSLPSAQPAGSRMHAIAYFPSVWCLDVQQTLLGRGAPFTGSAWWGVGATAFSFVFAILIYSLTYSRHFTRIPEQAAVRPGARRDKPSIIRRFLDRTLIRSPFQRATYHFACKTLFRSERHCLLFGAAAGVAFFFAASAVSEAFAEPVRGGIDARLLSVPLIISYFIICTLRTLFDLPTDPTANWVFQAIVDRHRHECRAVGTKVMLTMIVPWLVLLGFPLHVMKWGWEVGLLHTAYVLLSATALAELLLVGFRKIPFTCLYVASKDRVLIMVIVFLIGLSVFGSSNARLERWALEDPVRFLYLLPCFVAFFAGIRAREHDLHINDRILVFEDRPSVNLQLLNLSR